MEENKGYKYELQILTTFLESCIVCHNISNTFFPPIKRNFYSRLVPNKRTLITLRKTCCRYLIFNNPVCAYLCAADGGLGVMHSGGT